MMGDRPPFRPNMLEAAFTFADPPKPSTCYNPTDRRHVWSFPGGKGACPVPKHAPIKPEAPAPAPTPAPPPRVVMGEDGRSLKWQNGDTYEGDLQGMTMHGQGWMQYAASGDVYEGEFASGLRHGVGAYHYGASGVVTVSQFSRDRLVGVGLRWSGDRRRAWALLEGDIDPQNYRVAEPDPEQEAWLGAWEELTFDPSENGEVSPGYAWQLSVAFGLAAVAQRVGAPKITPGIDVETTQVPWWESQDVRVPADGTPTPAMRQAAYMDPRVRPTMPGKPLADSACWPWPLAHVVAGSSAPPTRRVVDRSIFVSTDAAARSAAKAAAAARQPAGRADAAQLYESIRKSMRRETGGSEPGGGFQGGVWMTPGAGPMQPSPAA